VDEIILLVRAIAARGGADGGKQEAPGRIKSRAQRRMLAELLVEGRLKPEVYERLNRAAGGKSLPEHVRKKTRKTRKRHSSCSRGK